MLRCQIAALAQALHYPEAARSTPSR